MNNLAIVFGIVAGIIHLAGYWIYNKELARKENNPNATSWAIWGLGSFMVVLLYQDLARDWVKEFLPTLCAVAALGTFVHMLMRGSFKRPERIEIFIFALDMCVVAFWLATSNPFLSNILLEIDIWISFVPIIMSVWADPKSENPKPWFIWSVAYALLTFVVIMRFEKWWDLLLPMNYLVLHLIVWGIARFRTVQR